LSHPTSSTTSKVFLDTCVLVSASVYGPYQDLGIQLDHRFYAKTVPLFEIIRKYVHKRIGIITFTIETQATAVIANAVTSELEERAGKTEDPDLKAKLFESHTVFFDQCLAHLQENLSILQREPVLQSEKYRYYSDVTHMYNNLQKMAENLDINQLIDANVTPRYRETIRHEVYEQYKKRYKQLLKLKSEPVEESDKTILCEAICLLNNYRKTIDPNIKMYLTSTDYHFSPYNSKGEITEQIQKKFQIVCDWPDEVAKCLKSDGFS
jgi:primosomal protein N''